MIGFGVSAFSWLGRLVSSIAQYQHAFFSSSFVYRCVGSLSRLQIFSVIYLGWQLNIPSFRLNCVFFRLFELLFSAPTAEGSAGRCTGRVARLRPKEGSGVNLCNRPSFVMRWPLAYSFQ